MILITGGAGFIGSNLVRALCPAADGLHRPDAEDVVVCDRLRDGGKWRNLADTAVADVIPPEGLMDWLAGSGADVRAIVHLGAISSTTETDVDLIWRVNVRLTLDLFDWCAARGRPFLYASSAAVYGDGAAGFDDAGGCAAVAALRPLNPYGWSKRQADLMILRRAAAGAAPPRWAGLRFFNVYGPNEAHKGPQSSVAPQFFAQIRDTGRTRLFRSERPDCADGAQARDFIHVDDCVAMMRRWLNAPGESGVYNCGTGRARTFADMAAAVFRAMNRPVAIDWVDMPKSLRGQYQYHTRAEMARARAAGLVDGGATSLEDGVMSYVRDHLMRDAAGGAA